MDNLNTYGVASLCAAFLPAEARRLAERLESQDTPRHGSWLNVAEIYQAGLERRLPEMDAIASPVRPITAVEEGRIGTGYRCD